jgi:hypothetical protein
MLGLETWILWDSTHVNSRLVVQVHVLRLMPVPGFHYIPLLRFRFVPVVSLPGMSSWIVFG